LTQSFKADRQDAGQSEQHARASEIIRKQCTWKRLAAKLQTERGSATILVACAGILPACSAASGVISLLKLRARRLDLRDS
jgi:hypothetical protein